MKRHLLASTAIGPAAALAPPIYSGPSYAPTVTTILGGGGMALRPGDTVVMSGRDGVETELEVKRTYRP